MGSTPPSTLKMGSMKMFIPSVLVACLVLGSAGCNVRTVKKGMIQFDQAFIPVFYYTYHGDMPRAKEAILFLEFQWQRFRNQYQATLPENEDWQESFRLIDDWLGDAYFTIDFNERDLALVQLEHVRFELMQLRDRNRIDYYIDYLYDFQLAMGLVAETAEDERLCLLEWSEFEELVREANTAWIAVRDHRPDAELFEFDAHQLNRLAECKSAVGTALERFNELVREADRQQVALAARAMEAKTLDLLLPFGHFESTQTYYAQLH